MNDSLGWIKIHRSILEWEWWDDIKVFRLFMYCLIKANHEKTKWHGENIERGSFVTSLTSLSLATKLTEQEIKTALDKLISTGEILNKSTNKYRVITICNYDTYQYLGEQEQQTNNKQSTDFQQTINSKQECKNERIIEESIEKDKSFSIGEQGNLFECVGEEQSDVEVKKRKPRKQKEFIPPTVEEADAYIKEKGYDIDAGYFVNKYESVGWMNGGQPVKNWKALINTWATRNKKSQQLSSTINNTSSQNNTTKWQ